MPRDNAKANRVIAEAWKREQKLVRQGMGTRNWTPEQQRDILETGKAHDEGGKAFEGHHMRSISKYPEYQSDPDNIQFLSRNEHTDAHGGSYQNPTNGFYDYATGKTLDFGDEKYMPCPIITLTEPIIKMAPAELISSDNNERPNNVRERTSEKSNVPPSRTSSPKSTSTRSRVINPSPSIQNQSRTKKPSFARISDGIDAIHDWWDNNGDNVKYAAKNLIILFSHSVGNLVIDLANDKMESMANRYADIQSRKLSHATDIDPSPAAESEESTSPILDASYPDSSDNSSVGSIKSPHLRRKHMSHYWTGAKAGKRVLEERWIDDIYVNSGKQDDPDDEN